VLALAAAPAQASLSAVTQPATSILEHSATLRGQVEPSGSTPFYYFEYGPTTAYGSKTLAVPFASLLKVQATVTGLQGGTLYHYRVVADRLDRAARGADQTFTTLGGGDGSDIGTPIDDPLGGLPGVDPPTGNEGKGGDGSSGSGGGDDDGDGSSGGGSGSDSGSGGG
jgi:uncharacterized membrane protein YgcG